jgi:hypothetical protein
MKTNGTTTLERSESVRAELVHILDQMLAVDEKITVRAITRRHSALKHASTITRNPHLMSLVTEHQKRQTELRVWAERLPKRSNSQIASQLAAKDTRISELETQIAILRVTVIGLIRAAGELGGTSKFVKLFRGYEQVMSTLQQIGAWSGAEVTEFSKRRPKL